MTVEDFSIKKDEAKSKNCQNYFLDCVSDFKCKLRRLFIKLNFFFIPLRAEQVSQANLHCKQGGINFTPFLLSLQYTKNKKLKFPLWMGVMSSVCLSVGPVHLIRINFFLQKLEKMCLWIFKCWSSGITPLALSP